MASFMIRVDKVSEWENALFPIATYRSDSGIPWQENIANNAECVALLIREQ